MSEFAFWTVIVILSGACGGGFLYLIGRISENTKCCSTIKIDVDRNKSDVNRKPDKEYLYENFYDKEKIDLHIHNIERSLKDMSDNQKLMNSKLDAVLIKRREDNHD